MEEVEDDGKVRLETLCGGAVNERFQQAFQEALDNIVDVDTPVRKKREIVIKVTLEPTEDREMIKVNAEVNKKLANPSGSAGLFHVGRAKGGRAVAYEFNPRQGRLALEKPAPVTTVGPGFPVEE